MIQNFEICDNFDRCLSQLEQWPNLAIGISRAYVRNKYYPQVYCFERKETLYEYSLKFLTQKDFPYMKELNRFVEMANAAGLIEKWAKSVPIQSVKQENSYSRLKTDNFIGVYILMVFGYFLIFGIFLFERYAYKKARERSSSKIWATIDMVIDGNRYFMLKNKMI